MIAAATVSVTSKWDSVSALPASTETSANVRPLGEYTIEERVLDINNSFIKISFLS
jgi:hypothetical protein